MAVRSTSAWAVLSQDNPVMENKAARASNCALLSKLRSAGNMVLYKRYYTHRYTLGFHLYLYSIEIQNRHLTALAENRTPNCQLFPLNHSGCSTVKVAESEENKLF